jgi:hypothetical protein
MRSAARFLRKGVMRLFVGSLRSKRFLRPLPRRAILARYRRGDKSSRANAMTTSTGRQLGSGVSRERSGGRCRSGCDSSRNRSGRLGAARKEDLLGRKMFLLLGTSARRMSQPLVRIDIRNFRNARVHNARALELLPYPIFSAISSYVIAHSFRRTITSRCESSSSCMMTCWIRSSSSEARAFPLGVGSCPGSSNADSELEVKSACRRTPPSPRLAASVLLK